MPLSARAQGGDVSTDHLVGAQEYVRRDREAEQADSEFTSGGHSSDTDGNAHRRFSALDRRASPHTCFPYASQSHFLGSRTVSKVC